MDPGEPRDAAKRAMRGPQPLDQEIRDGIVEHVHASCAIEASAGTGKTRLIVDRILRLIATGAALDRVVAITFTEKAAGELKSRVREAIQAAARDGGRPPEERQRFTAALADLDRSTISTIHSFCTELLRQRPVEAGISPGFGVADEVRSRLIMDEAWERWKDDELARLDSPLKEVLEAGAKLAELRKLADTLVENRDLLEKAAGTPLFAGPLPDWRAPFAAYCDAIRPERLAEIEARLGDCTAPDQDSGWQAVTEMLPALRRAAARILTGDPRAPLWALLAPRLRKQIGAYPRWTNRASLDRLRGLCYPMTDALDQFAKLYRTFVTVQAIRSLTKLLDIYEAIKSENGLADFQDLLIRTRNLVRDHPAVRRDLRSGIDFLLIDEFQDTDPLQAEIAFLLAAKEDPAAAGPDSAGGAPPAWDEVAVEPGRLVIVGDPKQSIYRFRRADIQVYERAKSALRNSGGELASITVNFRTRAGIAEWVNQVFGRLMPAAGAGGFRPAYSPLTAFRRVDEGRAGPAVVRLPLADPPDDGEEARRRMEAGRVAALIRKRVADGTWTVFSRAPDGREEPRPAAYGDVAVLFRTLTGLEIYEDAFRDAGVPYRIEGGKHYFKRQEVQSLLAVLRAIDSPNNRDSLVAALRSPFFGFDDETLLAAAAEKRLAYGTRRPPANPELARAFEDLKNWHERRHGEGPAAIVEEILERTRALEFFALQPLGHQRVANLLKVADEARRYTGNGGTYRSFVTDLSNREADMESESESPVFEEDETGYVQFLTVHAAKGLEFPVVITADLSTTRNSRQDRMYVDRERGRLAFRLEGLRGDSGHTPDWDELKEDEKEQQAAEEIRLFYVATTRARDLLILPIPAKRKKGECFLNLLEETDGPPEIDVSDLPPDPADSGGGRRTITPDDLEENAESGEIDRIRRDFAARRAALLENLPAGDRVITPSGLKPAEARPVEQWTAAGRAAAVPAGERGRALGSLVHQVLQRVALDGGDAEARLDQYLAGQAPLLSAADRPAALRLVRAALDHAVWARARRARRALRETPFYLKQADGVYVNGAVDLLIEEEAGLVVVDFKTDRVGEGGVEPLFARYRGQGLAYALGVTRSTGLRVREVIFVFLDNGDSRSLSVDAALLDEAAAVVNAAAAAG